MNTPDGEAIQQSVGIRCEPEGIVVIVPWEPWPSAPPASFGPRLRHGIQTSRSEIVGRQARRRSVGFSQSRVRTRERGSLGYRNQTTARPQLTRRPARSDCERTVRVHPETIRARRSQGRHLRPPNARLALETVARRPGPGRTRPSRRRSTDHPARHLDVPHESLIETSAAAVDRSRARERTGPRSGQGSGCCRLLTTRTPPGQAGFRSAAVCRH